MTDLSQIPDFNKKYHVEGRLGSGTYGAVYKVILKSETKNAKMLCNQQAINSLAPQEIRKAPIYYAAKKLYTRKADTKKDEVKRRNEMALKRHPQDQ